VEDVLEKVGDVPTCPRRDSWLQGQILDINCAETPSGYWLLWGMYVVHGTSIAGLSRFRSVFLSKKAFLV
jgi:hypothetical protein